MVKIPSVLYVPHEALYYGAGYEVFGFVQAFRAAVEARECFIGGSGGQVV
jgi:hypothetical protein